MLADNLRLFYLWGIKAILLVVPFLTLYIAKGMFFPFITGRAFIFYLLIELALVMWVGLMVLDKSYRPRINLVSGSLIIFLAIVGLADLMAFNSYLAFWSKMERVGGYLNLLHLTAYFFLLFSVFKNRVDWNRFGFAFIVVSLFQSIYAFLQKFGYIEAIIGGSRVEGTFGNPTFLAAFLLFPLALSFIGFLGTKSMSWRWFYVVAGFSNLVAIYLAATRGVILGLGVAIFLFCIGYLFVTSKNKKANIMGRRVSLAIIILAIVSPFLLISSSDTSFVRQNETLNRLASISFDDRTTQARFLVWNVAWQGVLERPILGWGQDNFIYVFNKYYDADLYNQEQWFDRAHNVVFDWLIAAGWLGLFSYLSLFVAMFLVLFKYKKEDKFDLNSKETLVVGSLLIAYFLQNLFVFDHLGTYLGFFAVLAFAAALLDKDNDEENIKKGRENTSVIFSGVALVIFIIISIFVSIRPMIQATGVVSSINMIREKRSIGPEVLASFEKYADYGTFGDTDAKEQIGKIVNDVINTPNGRQAPEEHRKAFVAVALREMSETIDEDPLNVRFRLFVGTIYTRFSEFDESYIKKGEEHLTEALKASPEKHQIYFALAENYMKQGDGERAFKILEKAVELAPQYGNARANLGFLSAIISRHDVVEEMISIDMSAKNLAKIGNGYINSEQFGRAMGIYEKVVEKSPGSPEYHASLAGLYLNQGFKQKAIDSANKARELDPDNYDEQVEQFLKNVEAQ